VVQKEKNDTYAITTGAIAAKGDNETNSFKLPKKRKHGVKNAQEGSSAEGKWRVGHRADRAGEKGPEGRGWAF